MRFTNNHWYVSVEAPSEWRPTTSRAPSSRRTKAFPTEIEAKQFAKAMLSEGLKVTAGTSNPHLPRRRQIAASEIDMLPNFGFRLARVTFFFPPLRPSATAAGSFPSSGDGADSSISPVAIA
jgi:hypothetical protein